MVSLLFGVLCAYLLLTAYVEIPQTTPFQEGVGSIFNALYFVALAGVGGTLLYLLLKRKKIRMVALITGAALTIAVFMLSLFYTIALFSMFPVPYSDTLVLSLSLGITVLTDFTIFRVQNRFSDLAVLLLGGALGAFLGNAIQIGRASCRERPRGRRTARSPQEPGNRYGWRGAGDRKSTRLNSSHDYRFQ
jgi:chromate transport protein ChrA